VRISISRAILSACLAGSLLTWLWSPVGLTQPPAGGAIPTSATQRAIELVKSAQTAYERGDYDRALKLCLQANAADPRYARAYTWMGAVYEVRGQKVQARQAYQRVLALAPDSPDAKHSRRRLRLLETTRDTKVGPASTAGVTPMGGSSQSLNLPIRILVNNRALPVTVVPIIREGRVLVPMRALFEKLGADVRFDGVARTVLAYRGESRVKMEIGRPVALINQRQVTLEQPPLLEGGTVMVPLRFVAEAMGAEVGWNGRDLIRITTPQPAPTLVASKPSNTSGGFSSGNMVSPSRTGTVPQMSRPRVSTPQRGPQDAASNPERTQSQQALPQSVQPERTPRANLETVLAEKLLATGQLRPAQDAAQVLGRSYSPAFVLSEQDGNLTFQLNKKWQWFEAEMAVPDKSPSSVAEIEGWLDNSPQKTAFKKLRLRANQETVPIRIPLAGATQLTLAPVYPGYPVLIINPRFLR
jgi:hypothetical protein